MKIGILGGGQLSRMLALAGIPLGLEFVFYFPKKAHALAQLGQIIHGDYTDQVGLQVFAKQVDVITFENENIPVKTLDYLAEYCPVFPDKRALQAAQHRLLEKQFFNELDIPTNQYHAVDSQADLQAAVARLGYPFILKTCTQGYDGKGQVKITHPQQLTALSPEQYQQSIAEEFIVFDREVSIVAARNRRGDCVFYDMCENTHHQGVLVKTQNKIADPIATLAEQYAKRLMTQIEYVGTLAIEFFQVGEQLIANEMAPRVHNSGHWTIDASITSQFENHLRSILDWPLGSPSSLTEATMYNLLSELPDQKTLLQFAGLRWHDYQKAPAAQRKLGHVTVLQPLAPERETALEGCLFDKGR